jgi:hypothetical protein
MLSALLRCGTLTVVAVALASCGGGGDDDAAGGSGPTEAQWRAELSRLCTSNHLATERLGRQVAAEGLSEKETTVRILRRAVEVERPFLDRLAAIRAPAAIQPEFDRFTDRLHDALPLFEDLADAFEQGTNDPELTTRAAKLAADTRPFATEHRLTACLPDQNG